MKSAIVLALWAAVAAAACRKTTTPPVGTETAADTAEQIFWDVRSAMTESGVRRGNLFADTIYVFNEQTLFHLRGVRATFNTETGVKNGTLRGDRGTYNLRTRILEGFGNVVVTSTDGKRLESPHLKYSERANQVSSDSAFTLTEKDRVQRGIGFVSDPNITSFRCLRACSGSANVPLRTLTP